MLLRNYTLIRCYHIVFKLFLLLSQSNLQIQAQNLIPNPSFEDFINFDTSSYQGWHKAQKTDTPDYFNLSKSKPFNNVFNTYIGGIHAKSGNCFAGFFCYRIHPNRNVINIREFIETPLLNTLEKDSLYRIQVSICLDAESNVAIKNFGILFSNTLLTFNKDFKLFAYKPQIEFNSTFLDNTSDWMTLQTYYKADGTEKFIVLGNFKPDKLTTIKNIVPPKVKNKKKKWNLSSKELAAYYYIDDVIVEKKTIAPILPEIEQEKELTDTFNLEDLKIDTAIVLKNIHFEFNKYDLLPQSYSELDKLYKLMHTNPAIRIKLEGHTDNIGSLDFNLQLSLRRTEAVVRYLIERGINPERIEFAGYGYTMPVASNDTEEGRMLNRRVVFKIIEK